MKSIFIRSRSVIALILLINIAGTTSSCTTVNDVVPPLGGIVAAATPEAAAAGGEILEAGGNAIDAAVAVSFALGVTEPAGSGLGGQSFFLIHPHRGVPVFINGTSFSPSGTPSQVTVRDITGHRATTVPSTIRVLEYVWKNYGSGHMAWAQLLEPAIRYAEQGFVIGRYRHRTLSRYAEQLRANRVAAQFFLRADGSVPQSGSVFKQPVLAKTLKRLAKNGADDFYGGEIAREIAADMRAHDGWLTLEDLANTPSPVQLPALKTSYRGWDVYCPPPPAGGWVVLQILNILQQAPQRQLAVENMTRTIWLAEALRIGHRNRRLAPVADLINYQADVSQKISEATARRLSRSMDRPGSGETTHFSVVDGQGRAVGVSQSINSFFGARAASPRLGFLYNSYMKEFELGQPDHPYALRPGAMPYSSMSPTVLSRHGEVGLVLGSPGSARIISSVVQVISHWVDVDRGIEAAVSAPRVHVVPDNTLYIESTPVAASLLAEMERRGFRIQPARRGLGDGHLDPYFGGVHAVARETSGWRGAADPRRDGAVDYARPIGKSANEVLPTTRGFQ